MNIYVPGTGFATQGPCPDGFHIPTKDEWDGVFTITDSLGITTGYSMRIKLHLPFGGIRNSDTTITNQGGLGYYWISAGSTSGYAYDVCFGVSVKSVRSTITRTVGEAIRPFKDSFVVPASGWTVIQGTLGSAGIFWNQTEGIISITSNGNTGYTISDKNCGATTVYSDGDTLSQANMGNMYQRGNNYGFPSTGNISNTSSTAVNAGSYGPGNYYSSSTWITATPWDSSDNYNLRGGTDGNVPVTTMEEVSNIYIGKKHYDGKELCFTAQEANSTVTLNKYDNPTTVTLETSTDGSTWSTYTFGSTITLSNIGDKVYFRNTSETDTGFSTDISNYYQFVMTGSIAGSGDTNYLLNKNSTTKVGSYSFGRLFENCSLLTIAPKLPATELFEQCYNRMFLGCTSLTAVPELPATTLYLGCYSYMFVNCSNLTTPPELPATNLSNSCYRQMFQGCTNLTSLPKLPATTLQQQCYYYMFRNCSKIKLSTTQTGEYQTSYRIPTTGTGTTATDALSYMFNNTGGTFTGTPTINTTYYTSNTVI